MLFGTDEESAEEQDDEDEGSSDSCNYENAVVIWEWPSAIACWLKSLFETEWELGDSDFSFDWDPYLSLTLGSHTLYSIEQDTVSVSQSDANSNDVIDSIESSAQSFILRNIPSRYVLEPKGTVTLETYLQKGDSVV